MSHLIHEQVNSNDTAFLYLNLHPGEEIKVVVRHHWAGFLTTLLLVLAMAVFPLFLLFAINLGLPGRLSEFLPIIVVLLSGYFIFLLTFLFGTWINFYYDMIFITNERLINVAQEGLLARKTSELSLLQVQNVSAEVTGFLQSFFNYGLLVVETAGEGTTDHNHPNTPSMRGYFTIEDLPDPNRIARVILELHRTLEEEDEG